MGWALSPQTDVLAYAKTIYNSMLQQIYVNPNQTVLKLTYSRTVLSVENIRTYTAEEDWH